MSLFNALSVINRIFYTVEGVLCVLAVSLSTSLSFVPARESILNSQYMMNIHNKSAFISCDNLCSVVLRPGFRRVFDVLGETARQRPSSDPTFVCLFV